MSTDKFYKNTSPRFPRQSTSNKVLILEILLHLLYDETK
jgi:hypothetical protein